MSSKQFQAIPIGQTNLMEFVFIFGFLPFVTNGQEIIVIRTESNLCGTNGMIVGTEELRRWLSEQLKRIEKHISLALQ